MSSLLGQEQLHKEVANDRSATLSDGSTPMFQQSTRTKSSALDEHYYYVGKGPGSWKRQKRQTG